MKDASFVFGQTIFFVFLSYLNLTERMYIYIFGAYLTVFFAGFTYYSIFIMTPGGGTLLNRKRQTDYGLSFSFTVKTIDKRVSLLLCLDVRFRPVPA